MTLRPTPPDGLIDGTRHLYAVRVYYEDTDLSQVAYHANYLRWFERARSDLLRRLDIDQRAAVESGEGAYAVADLSIRYLRPARLDDDIVIETQCTQLRAASCRMHQRALRGDELLAEADLRVGFVAPDGRPRRQPRAWQEAFKSLLSSEEEPQ
ncbi:YbgC/FadM family acyl-CoA thioesterase [Pelagerythrobacter marinus]|uniref:YbgC/FadM family acyl-CoA thioesterase n=1 Tax=Pelagerythrobacter marinus TaxID=538382 RepID=UPI0020367C84|nr:YbgC/FadM family acyl-CoA thioesterase [Pelagerythrobacter marinus]USA38574.1 YbgC/FadM family acyl-CoA thioesterase [Pelagerythrobacter marinus]WPZ07400.1 YbgC/FadM family acyl-CoA thioesterase [Pelagerythrobacter marinus]